MRRPTLEELRAIPPDVGTVPFGDAALQARFAAGVQWSIDALREEAKRLANTPGQVEFAVAAAMAASTLEQLVKESCDA